MRAGKVGYIIVKYDVITLGKAGRGMSVTSCFYQHCLKEMYQVQLYWYTNKY